MRVTTPAALIFATVLLGSSLASGAMITANTVSPGSLPPSLVILNLAGITTPSQATVNGNGYTVTFDNVGPFERVVSGATPGIAAIPVAGQTAGGVLEYLSGGIGGALNTVGDGRYLSTGLGTITITFDSPKTIFGLLWGSIDYSNQLSFNDSAGTVIMGSDAQAMVGPGFINGFQGFGGSAYVVIRTDTPFTTVKATSGVPSFEFDGVVAANPVPEPATCLLFGSGLIAMFAYRRRTKRA